MPIGANLARPSSSRLRANEFAWLPASVAWHRRAPRPLAWVGLPLLLALCRVVGPWCWPARLRHGRADRSSRSAQVKQFCSRRNLSRRQSHRTASKQRFAWNCVALQRCEATRCERMADQQPIAGTAVDLPNKRDQNCRKSRARGTPSAQTSSPRMKPCKMMPCLQFRAGAGETCQKGQLGAAQAGPSPSASRARQQAQRCMSRCYADLLQLGTNRRTRSLYRTDGQRTILLSPPSPNSMEPVLLWLLSMSAADQAPKTFSLVSQNGS